jgi:hypothetical protein
MRFVITQQIPQQVVMDAYPDWNRAPTYRIRLTKNASYYDDVDLYETDSEGIHAVGNNVNHGFLHESGRLF